MDGAPFLSFFRRAATAARRHSSKRSDGRRAKEEEPIPPCFFLIFPFRFSLFKKNGETQQRKTLAHLSFLSCDTKRTHQQPLNQGAQNVRCARCGHITSAVGGVGPSLPSGGPGAPDQQRDMAQLVCSSPQCRVVLMYPRGAERVQCSICGTTNCAIAVSPERTSPPPFSKGKKKKSKNPLSSGSPTHFFSFRSLSLFFLHFQANQVGHLVCDGCHITLMFAHGAQSVKCAVCNCVTPTWRPPLPRADYTQQQQQFSVPPFEEPQQQQRGQFSPPPVPTAVVEHPGTGGGAIAVADAEEQGGAAEEAAAAATGYGGAKEEAEEEEAKEENEPAAAAAAPAAALTTAAAVAEPAPKAAAPATGGKGS